MATGTTYGILEMNKFYITLRGDTMAYWINNRPAYPNELYHHGIKGMSWGVQNGPPYPLDRATHRQVVKQARAEKKANRQAFKDAKRKYEDTAFMYSDAKHAADKAAKKAAKAEAKAYKSQAHAEKAKALRTDANAARARSDFWKEGHDKVYSAYKQSAERAGKKVRYSGDEKRSLARAGGRATTRGNNQAIGIMLGGAIGGSILGGAHNAKRIAELRRQARDIENQFYSKVKAKSEYKAQKANGARHTGNTNTQKVTKTTSNSGVSPQKDKAAIMKEMNLRFGNSEKNKAALSDLKTMLKTTKGEYHKDAGMTTYVTQYGIFDVYYGPNGTIRNVSFND